MKKNIFEQCKCKTCEHVIIEPNKYFGRKITCPYSNGKGFLGDFLDETLVECCSYYKKGDTVNGKKTR